MLLKSWRPFSIFVHYIIWRFSKFHNFHVPFVLFSLVLRAKTEVTVCVALRMVRNGAPKRFQLMENHPRSVQAVLLPQQRPIEIQQIFQPPNSVQHFWHKPIGHLSRNYLKLVLILQLKFSNFVVLFLSLPSNWSNFQLICITFATSNIGL